MTSDPTPQVPSNFADLLDRALLYIGRRQPHYYETVQIFLEKEYQDAGCESPDDFKFIVTILSEEDLVFTTGDLTSTRTNYYLRLTHHGWLRFDEILRSHVASHQAFVAMWFDNSMDSAYNDGIEPALEATGFSPYRVDKRPQSQLIDNVIITEIRRSGLLVADFTNNNEGVYFETGYAMGLGRQVIRTCRRDWFDAEGKGVHFDKNHYPFLLWDSPDDLQDQLINWIRATVEGAT